MATFAPLRATPRTAPTTTPAPVQARGSVDGLDLNAFLRERVLHVLQRRALCIALPALVVERPPAVHGAAVVPHHEIVDTPAMAVDELALGRERGQLLEQRRARLVRHAEDAAGMRGEIEARAARGGMVADQHLLHGW